MITRGTPISGNLDPFELTRTLGISCTLLVLLIHLKTCSNESQSSAALPKGLVGRCHLDAGRNQAPVVAIVGDRQVVFAPLQIHMLLPQSD